MKVQTSATVNQGQLILDEPLPLPNDSRVQVTVEADEDWRARYRAGLDELLRLNRERPIKAGIRFSREELYDRR
jgi:hypothetical protein